MKNILILNGSLGEKYGNTNKLIKNIENIISKSGLSSETIHLKELLDQKINQTELKTKLEKADGFLFTSGTYWDSWGSPMQYFLEIATEFEASDIFLSKPAAVIITMHSVGGKGVLSRLQGVLNTLGMLIPPMSGMVYSLAGQLALENDSSFADDFWSLDDIEVVLHNLLASLNNTSFKSWPVDHKNPKRIWIK